MKELKEANVAMPTGRFILLTIFTLGLYSLIWLAENKSIFKEKLRDMYIPEGLFLAVIITWEWSAFLDGYLCELKSIVNLSAYAFILGITCTILTIIMEFKLKYALEQKYGTRLSAVYVLVFGCIYLNHVIYNSDKVVEITAPVNNQPSSLEQLEKYAELKDKGILTEEEFQVKKKEILENFNG